MEYFHLIFKWPYDYTQVMSILSCICNPQVARHELTQDGNQSTYKWAMLKQGCMKIQWNVSVQFWNPDT